MEYRLFFYIFKSVIYIMLLFFMFYMLEIFAVSNFQISSSNVDVGIMFKKYNSVAISDYKKVSFDRLKEIDEEEIIIINTSPYFSDIFTFSPEHSLRSSYVTDTADYLKYIPGFTFIRNGGVNSEPVFRGMFGSRIRVLIENGEMLGACCSRMDPSSAYIYPGTFDILNLIKGPQTVLLGPVSSGGILQFERYHPRFDMSRIKLHSNITVGSNNKIDKSIDSIIGSKYGYVRLISNVSHSDDYYDGHGCRVNSAWYKWNTDAVLSLNIYSNTSLEISIGQGNGSANYAASMMNGLCFARESYGIKIETIDISDVINKVVFYTWYNYMNHLMENNIVYDITNFHNRQCGNCLDNNVDRCIWGMRSIIVNQWENFECHSGIDMQINQHRKIRCNNNWNTDIITRDFGIFSELTFNMLLNRKFIGGIRLERYSVFDTNHDFIYKQYHQTYPAGFIRYENNIYPFLRYYAGIGTSKRFPDYWELLHINSKKNIYMKCNNLRQQLNPEQTIQIDTGACFEYLQVNGWISSYIGYIKDFILSDYNNFDRMIGGDIDCVNNINVKICGAEAELDYILNDNWCVKSNVTWSRGLNINDGCSLPKVPPLEGTLICQWKRGFYNVALLWRVVSAFRSNNLINVNSFLNDVEFKNYIKTSGFGIFSANLTWTCSKNYILNIGVENLLNRNYKEYFNVFLHKPSRCNKVKNLSIYEPGRTWWIKAEIII